MTAFSNTPIKSKNLISELELYTKENNCIRGTKLRDVDMIHAKFEEVTGLEGYSFEKYYYQQYIRDIFDMEVFGFLDNIEEYNSLGIDKRGVMTYGPPGTGKTTLGKIICNKAGDKTVIWVTPDLIAENTQSKHAIKLLYMLADFVSPSALLLEDIDLWANDRDDMGDTLRLGALMNILDGVNSIKNCVTIAMTNRIELIEKALRNRPGRFDVIVEIPALIKVLRERMLKDRLFNIQVDDDVIPYVLQESEGWTGAYVQHFVHTANMYFVYHKVPKHLTLDVAKNVLGTIKKFTYRERGEESLGFK